MSDANIQVGVLGLGRFGAALVDGLSHLYGNVKGRGRKHAEQGALSYWTHPLEIICLAVRDDQIEEVVNELQDEDFSGKTILMHSGAKRLALLEPLQRRGARIGKLHPLLAFTNLENAHIPKGTPFAIEGDIEDLVEPWIEAWDGSLYHLSGDQWLTYHLAAVMAANFLPLMIRAGSEILTPMAKDQADALDWLAPLVRSSVAQALDASKETPYAGPAIRGDMGTMDTHEAWLVENRKDLLPLYDLCSRLIGEKREG